MNRLIETKQILENTRQILRQLIAKNIAESIHTGTKETYLTNIAGSVGEIDGAISKINNKLK